MYQNYPSRRGAIINKIIHFRGDVDIVGGYPEFLQQYRKYCGDSLIKQNPKRGEGDITGGRSWEHYAVFHNADFKPTDVVLEYGAWTTFFGLLVARYVKEITITDNFEWSDLYHMGGDGNFTTEGWIEEILSKKLPNVKAEASDITRTQYPNKTFDKIISTSVLEHIEDDIQAMRESERILKDDGLIVITIDMNGTNARPYRNNISDKTRVYTKASFEELIAHTNLEMVEELPDTHHTGDGIYAGAIVLRKKHD